MFSPRHLLNQFGLHAKKSLGQNFLADEAALRKVAGAADLTPADTVLEIGPGLGSLTRHIAEQAGRVLAVEIDQTLLPALEHVLAPYTNVEVISGDVLRVPLAQLQLPPGYKVVANIPYYITSAILRHLLEHQATRPSIIVLTIQREVAERICAAPGDLSLLAVSVQFYSQPCLITRLPAGAFYPRPEVDSAVLRLDVYPQPVDAGPDVETFFRVVRAGFGQKRKQLRNALSAGLGRPAPTVEAWLRAAGVEPHRRAETLTLAEWGALARAYSDRAHPDRAHPDHTYLA
jgi:16S rRNA (adenine1518-N6/adenine1519-N6)-dimethyltransferase